MVEDSALRSWTYINAALVGLRTYRSVSTWAASIVSTLAEYNYGEFGGLLPPVEDLYQKVLCFAAKVAT